MVGNLLASEPLLRQYQVSFSYRYSPEYERGFNARVATTAAVFPLELRDVSSLHARLSRLPRLLDKSGKLLLVLLQIRYVFFVWNTLTLLRLFRRQGVELLHVNNGGYPGAYSCNSAVLAARLAGVSDVVYVINNVAQPYASPLRWTDYPMDRITARSGAVFVTGSRTAAAALQRVLKLPPSRVRTLHNGITPRAIRESPENVRIRLGVATNRTVIGMVAVIEPRKGHLILLQALALLRSMVDATVMPIVLIEGAGPRLAALREQIRAFALDDCVTCVGNEPNVFDFLNAVDVVVLPSTSHEDFPNVIVEAMSLGKAVVASRLAGIPEQIVENESGVLVAPGNAKELAEALRILVTAPEEQKRLGLHARVRFNRFFRSETAVERYLELYNELIHVETI